MGYFYVGLKSVDEICSIFYLAAIRLDLHLLWKAFRSACLGGAGGMPDITEGLSAPMQTARHLLAK